MDEFASFYPKACPPIEAEKPNCFVYRVIKNSYPQESDFIPYFLEFPNRDWKGKECIACGLSVFLKEEDAQRIIDVNNGTRVWKVVKAFIDTNTGRFLQTPREGNSHCTWWVYSNVKPERLFRV